MMKFASLACILLVAAAGCDKHPSKLDKTTGGIPPGARAEGGGGGGDPQLAAKVRELEMKVTAQEGMLDRFKKLEEPLNVLASSIEMQKGKLQVEPWNLLDGRLKKMEAYTEALQFVEGVMKQRKAEQDKKDAREPDPNGIFAIDIANDVALGMIEGAADAPVTVVKAFDFACPACMQMNDHLKKLVKEHEGKVRIVYKNFVIHENARPAHLGSCAAAKQGKYLAFKEAFWEKGYKPFLQSVQARKNDNTTMEPAYVVKIAGEAGLDTAKFEADMNGDECKKLLDDDRKELDKFEISGTPTLYINGSHWSGQDFDQVIEEKVKLASASGVAAGEYYQKEIMAKGEKKFRNKRTPKP